LYYLGTVLPGFREAARWRRRGRDILLRALDYQLRPDGVYFEQSSYYQRYTADFYTHFHLLSRAGGRAAEDRKVTDKLALLLDHLMHITRPDGTTPLLGDDDGGRLAVLDERAANDFRSTLATAAALFARGDYKYVAERATEETLWLLGPEGLRAFDQLEATVPADESRAFKDGGYFVMRDGWASDSNYLLVDCGPHGAVNSAHAHADALAVELAARGRALLVDAGTYTYTGSAELRDLFRSSAAHNTLTVDGESSSVPAGTFRWRHAARSTLRVWVTHPRFDYFEGSHDGYGRLADPATHARSILFLKGRYWVMRDRVEARGSHRYDLHFHFSPGADPSAVAEDGAAVVREAAGAGGGLELLAFGGRVTWRGGWVSTCYGERRHAPVFSLSAAGEGSHEFFTFMIPAGEPRPAATAARELNASGGRLFEVRASDARDYLLACDGNSVEGGRFISDFSWAWARFTADGARLEELILVGGSRFSLDGRPVFEAAGRAGYVVARRVGSELLVETDARERSRVALEDEEARRSVYSV
ncbi:MAG TPA: alginate lyase family protein, partial [Pyrinomonadaceae bacterium]|nr:alginate lyase family protein [Pyrinomonadaceae bacterium]